MLATFYCAYCGEPNETVIDEGGAHVQRYTEDCQVCCRPNELHVTIDEETGEATIENSFEG
jgi:hypothetical protein